ncbi:hypothetical protein Q5H93_17485 [Hymenobacter sp. ASUV-10]|uniref:Uncharacterized protein n=1 Tax=Hymenobacter aranciens TaxID=3063996 RepID=A0ABT9BE45_9BACT|nr:hypothetical protein [Hymenobacter sp. ASUV-10]MDO7876541.1 hypothetical protein [Hymenobacter sp. ASUV-10]
MSNSFAGAPPANLAQWLGRSLAGVAACVLACGGLWYLIVERADAMCVSCGTSGLLVVLTPALLLGQWLAFRQGLSLFKPASAGPTKAPAGIEVIACLWCLFQLLLHGCWGCLNLVLLLCTLLAVGDPNPGLHF